MRRGEGGLCAGAQSEGLGQDFLANSPDKRGPLRSLTAKGKPMGEHSRNMAKGGIGVEQQTRTRQAQVRLLRAQVGLRQRVNTPADVVKRSVGHHRLKGPTAEAHLPCLGCGEKAAVTGQETQLVHEATLGS
jgi:hypothetical protein